MIGQITWINSMILVIKPIAAEATVSPLAAILNLLGWSQSGVFSVLLQQVCLVELSSIIDTSLSS